MCERESVSVCVCVREKEGQGETGRECVYVRVRERERVADRLGDENLAVAARNEEHQEWKGQIRVELPPRLASQVKWAGYVTTAGPQVNCMEAN